eukprot:319648_1
MTLTTLVETVLLILIININFAPSNNITNIIHVDHTNSLPFVQQNGKTWQTAFNSLQRALDTVKENQTIFIATGMYYDLNVTNFKLEQKNNINIIGGFNNNTFTNTFLYCFFCTYSLQIISCQNV